MGHKLVQGHHASGRSNLFGHCDVMHLHVDIQTERQTHRRISNEMFVSSRATYYQNYSSMLLLLQRSMQAMGMCGSSTITFTAQTNSPPISAISMNLIDVSINMLNSIPQFRRRFNSLFTSQPMLTMRVQHTNTRQLYFFWYSAVHNSRSMTPITWQVAVDDEEQRPLLQDILEAAVDDRRQAAVDVEEQRPQLQDIFEAAIDGNHV